MTCPQPTSVWDAIEFVAGAAAFVAVVWLFQKYNQE